ncbi:(2Fe-2S)-binding protein [Massilia arenosa]|uniref:(2Fe-2S)-binding protein n=1 Tax=Zemynaea arenosa TaxID=2561931 RepID=A0A4Y9S3K4_9BURK|nr:(2Fe-2S)-binding protein [Massilia arenosa]TFW15888.1 (2Fe-2S)-binding protein [Massilia arenosa]
MNCTLLIDGRSVEVPAGVTVAAALAIAGRLHTRTSVSGMPRFAVCGMGVCQECHVTIDGVPHRLACQVRCTDGMSVRTGAAPQEDFA